MLARGALKLAAVSTLAGPCSKTEPSRNDAIGSPAASNTARARDASNAAPSAMPPALERDAGDGIGVTSGDGGRGARTGAAPIVVTLTGTITNVVPGYMPGGKNGGRTQGWVEIFGELAMDPPPPGRSSPKAVLAFDEKTSIVSASGIARTGKCTVTIGGFEGHAGLMLTATEPGCDAKAMLDEKLPQGLDVTTRARYKPTSTLVTVKIKLAPAKP